MKSSTERAFLPSKEAADFLKINRSTLYAYVSRGWIHPIKGPGRGNFYPIEELQRLKARSDARSGHGAVAAAALSWGEPVIESQVFSLDNDRPCYRGEPLSQLLEADLSFESVTELLWSPSKKMDASSQWVKRSTGSPPKIPPPTVENKGQPLVNLQADLLAFSQQFGRGLGYAPEGEMALARQLLLYLTTLLSQRLKGSPASNTQRPSIAQTFVAGLGAPMVVAPYINQALILCAEHGLTTSTFACRVVASTGADLIGCLLGGVAALSGPRHGGMCKRIENLFQEAEEVGCGAAIVRTYFERGQTIPGFSHPLYPEGDPRGMALLTLANNAEGHSPQPFTDGILSEMKCAGYPGPTLDFGLVALRRKLGLPLGTAPVIFALGRIAGWVAHILEQRQSGQLLRPRARYRTK